ncbi:MAG: orotidine-5'-phosphate decarboxylase [Pyrinomonadaceae bacterium]
MTQATQAKNAISKTCEKIIVALDVETRDEARQILGELNGKVVAFKIGMQLFTAAGPEFVREVTSSGVKVFLDLKFHDIPNTVANAGVEAARLGVWMFNVHAIGGSEMMKRTANDVAEFCLQSGVTRPHIIGVTVLTSSTADTLKETGFEGSVEHQVTTLARLAHFSGLDGVVASPREVIAIKAAVDDRSFLTVTPGIRPTGGTTDDQRRVTTLRDAIAWEADYVVIGRPITQAADRVKALESMIAEAEN